MSAKVVDLLESALHRAADVNKDGKVDKKDISRIASRLRAAIEEETVKYPIGAVIIAAIMSSGLVGLLCWAFH